MADSPGTVEAGLQPFGCLPLFPGALPQASMRSRRWRSETGRERLFYAER